MAILQIILLLLGVVVFAIGYRSTHRNKMLIGAVLMVIAFAIPDLITGFRDGFRDGYNNGLTSHSSGPISGFARV